MKERQRAEMGREELDLIVNRDLLFDFYGELLTEHQKRIFTEVVFDDYSISEVARDEGISRQGVSDLIRRTQEQLESYETKLGLVGKFRKQRRLAREITAQAEAFREDERTERIDRIIELSGKLSEEV
ncbi:putative DNA-binding protein YlxM (UPF0122 family) [Moryella indoligenes]|uniref:UPF0122 protein J2S20_001039 n=2 Tax=Moryella indoligenes TaxID=371674 RepID=A0AAE4AKS4_9FIRM|nr:DNA-binding protein [Moryella indoligenes]MDQ0152350.1 putative DNA-binding protein YlxM (UPF0122 family) [Moryella indoligenes]